MKITNKNKYSFENYEISLVIIKSKGDYTYDVNYFNYDCDEITSLAFEHLNSDFIYEENLDEYLELLKKEWDVILLNDERIKTCDKFEKTIKE